MRNLYFTRSAWREFADRAKEVLNQGNVVHVRRDQGFPGRLTEGSGEWVRAILQSDSHP